MALRIETLKCECGIGPSSTGFPKHMMSPIGANQQCPERGIAQLSIISSTGSEGSDLSAENSRYKSNGGNVAILASSDFLYVEAIKRMWGEADRRPPLFQYHSAAETIQLIAKSRPRLLIIGPQLSDADEIAFLVNVQCNDHCNRILMITARSDQQALLALRHPSIVGIINTNICDSIGIRNALEKVYDLDGKYFPSDSRSFSRASVNDVVLSTMISRAELNVFRAIADGCDDIEASGRLKISSETVRTHRRNIMRKLGLSSSRRLVAEALRLGILRSDSSGRLCVVGASHAPEITAR